MKNSLISQALRQLKAGALLLVLLFIVSSCDDENEFSPTLITINVENGAIDGDERIFVIASAADGTVITYDELINGQTTVLSSETYKEKNFTLSEVNIYEDSDYKDVDGISYHEVRKGLKVNYNVEEDEDGFLATFTITGFDAVNANYYSLSSNGSSNTIYENGDLTNYFSKGSSKIFVGMYDQNYNATKYLFTSNTFAAQTAPHALDLSAVSNNFSTETVNFGESVYSSLEINGNVGTGAGAERFYVFGKSGYGTTLEYKFPGTAFSSYSSYSYVEGDNGDGYYEYYAYNKSAKSDFNIPSYEIEYTADGTQISYSVGGGGDWAEMDIDWDGASINEYYDWDVYLPVGADKSVTIPQLPQEIDDLLAEYVYGNWVFDTSDFTIVDFADFSNISGFFSTLNTDGEVDSNYKTVTYSEGCFDCKKNNNEKSYRSGLMPERHKRKSDNIRK